MTSSSPSSAQDLWAITSYFNPMRYHRRLANFKIFRAHLSVPLVAVELAYDSDFELQEQDADILIRLRGGAVLWQKERLLNIALQALPNQCRKVAWLDCDILFSSRGWVERANVLLDQFPIIQLFRRAHYLGLGWVPEREWASQAEFTRPSAIFSLASGVPAAMCLGRILDNRRISSAAGLAWAARREFLQRHCFFDVCILGGGDRAIACAAIHYFEGVMQSHYMNEKQRTRYIGWAESVSESVQAEVAFLDADICHVWHGDIDKRVGRARHEGFQRFQFDPYIDIEIEGNGAWRWATDKRDMHEYVRRFFASRQEDG
jgi:hypothetical protein